MADANFLSHVLIALQTVERQAMLQAAAGLAATLCEFSQPAGSAMPTCTVGTWYQGDYHELQLPLPVRVQAVVNELTRVRPPGPQEHIMVIHQGAARTGEYILATDDTECTVHAVLRQGSSPAPATAAQAYESEPQLRLILSGVLGMAWLGAVLRPHWFSWPGIVLLIFLSFMWYKLRWIA